MSMQLDNSLNTWQQMNEAYKKQQEKAAEATAQMSTMVQAFETMEESFKKMSNSLGQVHDAVNQVYSTQSSSYSPYIATTPAIPATIKAADVVVPVSEEICWKFSYYVDVRDASNHKYYITEYWMEVNGQKYKYHNPLEEFTRSGYSHQINNGWSNQMLTSAKPLTIVPSTSVPAQTSWTTYTSSSSAGGSPYTASVNVKSPQGLLGGTYSIPYGWNDGKEEQQVWEGAYLDLITLVTHEKYEYRVFAKYMCQQIEE